LKDVIGACVKLTVLFFDYFIELNDNNEEKQKSAIPTKSKELSSKLERPSNKEGTWFLLLNSPYYEPT